MTNLPETEGCDIMAGELPADTPTEVRAFLLRWRPDLCIWSGGNLRRTLLRQLHEMSIDALLVDLTLDELPGRTSRWLPDQRRRMLDSFTTILTPDEAVRSNLLRFGLTADRVLLSGHLRISTTPPACNEAALADLQDSLGSRPVWLATHIRPEELPTLLEAHRGALRLLHRLLLVISLDGDTPLETGRAALHDSGLHWADWEAADVPNDYTQVLLADCEDLGLWYRLAPVCLMGGSLIRGMGGHSPLDAAALGSAILHGPGITRHQEIYSQLSMSGAAERVNGPQELSEMVIYLSAPDMAAEMAFAGWEVVTAGAEMTDQLIERVQDMLDLREDRNATA